MPKVHLTTEQREEARERREMGRLTTLIQTAKYRLNQPDTEIAAKVGVSGARISQLKHPFEVENVPLCTARRIAHAVGCTAEDWLKIGGFGE